MKQSIYRSGENYAEFDSVLYKYARETRVLLVCGNSAKGLTIYKRINQYFTNITEFNQFTPNPEYEQVLEGIEVLHRNQCGLIIALGGGSAMDVAKSIKMMANMDQSMSYFEQTVTPSDYELIAIPTTAGSGAESTHFAVIYSGGEKKSIEHEQILPSIVILDASVLDTLSLHQRKSTMLDALSHCIESFWSVNSTEESRGIAIKGLKMVLENANGYIANETAANLNMLTAANLAGQAIDITKTTAGHAMCYMLTKWYGITHGMAAAMNTAFLYRFSLNNTEACIDKRGRDYFENVLNELARCFGADDVSQSENVIIDFLDNVGIEMEIPGEPDYSKLVDSVNLDRLKNNPVKLEAGDIENIYQQVFAYLEK